MMNLFNARDWYWSVANVPDKLYASKRNIYVDATDADYVAWKAVNGNATPPQVADESDVWFYVNEFLPAWLWNGTTMAQPAVGQYTKAQLQGYSADARYRRASGGCTVAGKPYTTDPMSRNAMDGAHRYAVAHPGYITNWKLADGTFNPMDEAALADLTTEIATFVQDCFTCESTNLTAINGGTMTTIAQIDAAYASVSNVLP